MNWLSEFLSEEGVKAINEYFDTAQRRHPAWSALNLHNAQCTYDRAPKDYLVNGAIDLISRTPSGRAWLTRALKRLSQTKDFEESVSALAEIRCYGAMLDAGFEIRPVPRQRGKPTPDFEFELDGVSGVIEVTAKLEHDDQVARARQIAAGGTPSGAERRTRNTAGKRIDLVLSEGHPFGAPDPKKVGDTTQTNAISRICSIKAKETQREVGKSSILWIDFRDLSKWPGMLSPDQALPVISGKGGLLCSGAIWHAFYGSKGLPLFDSDWGGGQLVTQMAHFGRFHREASKISDYCAALFCLDKAAILFENPIAAVPLTSHVRATLTRVPWFDLGHSITNWQPGNVDLTCALAQSVIEALHNDRTNAAQ